MAKVRLSEHPDSGELYPAHCRACGRYLCQVFVDPHRMRMFCPEDVDPWCAISREWFYDNDREREWLLFLAEVEQVPVPELSRLFGQDRYRIHATVQNHYRRALRARQ